MSDEIWGKDLLNVKARGETFTSLIKSIDDSKVISIEAGFGHFNGDLIKEHGIEPILANA